MNYLKTGKILKTVALKGEVKLFSTTHFAAQRYKIGNTVYCYFNNEYIPLNVKKYRNQNGFDFLVFKDLEDINLVEKYVGCEIFIKKEETKLEKNQFFFDDLLNSKVYEDEKYLGIAIEIKEYPAQNVLIVQKENGKTFMIPYVSAFIKDVDINNKIIKVKLIEGMDA